MKLLLNTCVCGSIRQQLEAEGYNVIWSGDWDEDPGDEEILSYAYTDNRVLITLDKDFGELAILRAIIHCGIIRGEVFNLNSSYHSANSFSILNQSKFSS